jgi:hypothetical protein
MRFTTEGAENTEKKIKSEHRTQVSLCELRKAREHEEHEVKKRNPVQS